MIPSIAKLVKLQLKFRLFFNDGLLYLNDAIDNVSVGTCTSNGPTFLLSFSGFWVDVVRSHEFGLLELVPVLVLEV